MSYKKFLFSDLYQENRILLVFLTKIIFMQKNIPKTEENTFFYRKKLIQNKSLHVNHGVNCLIHGAVCVIHTVNCAIHSVN